MDQLQDFLVANLPPNLLSTLSSHSSTYYKLYTYLQSVRRLFTTYATPLLTRLLSAPDIATLVLFAIILLLSLKILDLLRRAVVFWTVLVLRVTLYAALAAAGWWVWQRGPQGVADDLGAVGELWMSEYSGWKDKWEGRQQVHGARGRGRRKKGSWS